MFHGLFFSLLYFYFVSLLIKTLRNIHIFLFISFSMSHFSTFVSASGSLAYPYSLASFPFPPILLPSVPSVLHSFFYYFSTHLPWRWFSFLFLLLFQLSFTTEFLFSFEKLTFFLYFLYLSSLPLFSTCRQVMHPCFSCFGWIFPYSPLYFPAILSFIWLLWYGLCVLYTCVCVNMYGYAHLFTCIQRPEKDIECPCLSLPLTSLWQGLSLNFCGAWDLNAGPNVWEASLLTFA